jgi:hypothetical protein
LLFKFNVLHRYTAGSYDDFLRLWDVRQMSRPVETAAANCGGGVWWGGAG